MLVSLLLLVGCKSGGEDSTPTWHADIAPLMARSCQGCHTQGGISPFPLETYEQASVVADMVAEAVEAGRMPPFGAQDTNECTPPAPWKDDLRLSEYEIALVRAWADAGAPEGDSSQAAPLPEPPSVTLDDADGTFEMPSDYAVEGTEDDFRCFVLDGEVPEDVWVTGVQVEPGNDAVVHHVLVWADPNGDSAALAEEDGSWPCFGAPGFDDTYLLSAWAPGAVPLETPDGVGIPLPAGSKVVVNVHYHPTGDSTELDRSKVELKWRTDEPAWETETFLIGNFERERDDYGLLPGPNDDGDAEFRIPAGAVGHTEEMFYTLDSVLPELPVWLVGTHMHYVGTDMRIWVESDDEEQCMIQTPDWNFEWQRGYAYDTAIEDAPTVRGGDVLRMKCTYDNSLGNPFVVEALKEQGLSEPVDVLLGEETLDEMCLGVFGIAWPTGLL